MFRLVPFYSIPLTDQVNLAAATPDGRQTKSSTFHMIGEDYNLALGINFDYTSLVFANRIFPAALFTISSFFFPRLVVYCTELNWASIL